MVMQQLSSFRVFETGDIDEGQEFASQVWEHNRTRVTDGVYGLRWNYLRLDRTDFSYVEQDAPAVLRAEGPLSDNFRLYIHQGGSIGHVINGRAAYSDRTRIVAHAPGVDLQAKLAPFKVLIVGLHGKTVRDGIGQRFRRVPAPQDWVGALPASPCTDALCSMIGWLTNELDRPGSPLATAGRPRRFAERTLLSLFVECLAETAPGEAEPVLDIGETQVRRAEAWIEHHLTEPIGTYEVASAIGIGARSLQMSFRRLRSCSPSEAIARRRLDNAHRVLLHADESATVTRIAAELGFYELGRFAARYRERFGENPSATLARSPGAREGRRRIRG